MDELKKRIKKTEKKIVNAEKIETVKHTNFGEKIDELLRIKFLEKEELKKIDKISDSIKKYEHEKDI